MKIWDSVYICKSEEIRGGALSIRLLRAYFFLFCILILCPAIGFFTVLLKARNEELIVWWIGEFSLLLLASCEVMHMWRKRKKRMCSFGSGWGYESGSLRVADMPEFFFWIIDFLFVCFVILFVCLVILLGCFWLLCVLFVEPYYLSKLLHDLSIWPSICLSRFDF